MLNFMNNLLVLNTNYLLMNGPLSKPTWRLPNTIKWTDGKTEFLEFRAEVPGIPNVVIVAPEAAHDSTLVDWAKNQSLVQCALDNQLGGVFVLSKLPARSQDTKKDMEYMFNSLSIPMLMLKEQFNLIGLCQGGPQAAIVANRNPHLINSLTIAGSPMKTSAAISSIQPFLDEHPQEKYEEVVAKYGNMPGKLMLAGFLANKPNTFRHDEMYRLTHADDPAFVKADQIFRNWYYGSVQDVPGLQYLQLVARCFRDDLENWYDLTQGDYPVNLIAGTRDPICPEGQVFAFAEHCQGLVNYFLLDAGHIGIFMSKKAIATIWVKIFQAM